MDNIGLVVIVILVTFFLGRFLMLWYWRINEALDLLKTIAANTTPPEEDASCDS